MAPRFGVKKKHDNYDFYGEPELAAERPLIGVSPCKPKASPCKAKASPCKSAAKPLPSTYNGYISEVVKRLAGERPEMKPSDRLALARDMYKAQKRAT